MKEWIVIHKIKSLYDEGRGLSERAIAKELGISRNTVKKYIDMDEKGVEASMESSREKTLDAHKDSIIRLLQTFPRLSAVKVLRKLQDKVPGLDVSARSMRRYIGQLKDSGEVAKRIRNYEPVVDMLPGMQCQIDGGELRKVLINGAERTVYFVVFVLSCSRLMHVCASLLPISTDIFIRMHDAAFRAFGGMPEECVYDQAKVVVIDEKYRELKLNQHFSQYANTAGFRIHICCGYDPESKGKVESGVKYVKENCFYGEVFTDFPALEGHLADWLKNIANVRTHGTTNRQPSEHYESEERAQMKAYFTPVMPEVTTERQRRKVDKTGFISWHGNRYSVPLQHQRGEVYIVESKGNLLVYDVAGKVVATWIVGVGKGEIFKNHHHYRDPEEQIKTLEKEIINALGESNGKALCQLIRKKKPSFYKDQLRGLSKELTRLGSIESTIMTRLLARESISVLQLVEAVEAWRSHPERLQEIKPQATANSTVLEAYSEVGKHVVH